LSKVTDFKLPTCICRPDNLRHRKTRVPGLLCVL